jgi:ferredoxin
MKARIDEDRCPGHGRCYSLAPELFDCDDSGYGAVRVTDAPESLRRSALTAVNNCPERAISVEEV